jgi:hypothetical protein
MKNDRVCDFCLAPKYAIVRLYSSGEQGVSDFCLAPKLAIVLLYSCREQVVFQWNDVFFLFTLDQHD